MGSARINADRCRVVVARGTTTIEGGRGGRLGWEPPVRLMPIKKAKVPPPIITPMEPTVLGNSGPEVR